MLSVVITRAVAKILEPAVVYCPTKRVDFNITVSTVDSKQVGLRAI
jgi:hypothetical protein